MIDTTCISAAVTPEGTGVNEIWDYPSGLNETLPYAYGNPTNSGSIKANPDDFLVDEELGFALDGEGEHIFLRIEKVGENTEYVARLLARFAGVPPVAVGYAGLKDRHGRTRQWFSVGLAGQQEPDWALLNGQTLRIIETGRHRRKLKKGALAGNRFHITLRSITGLYDELEARLRCVVAGGVPNYFGPQRFGRNAANLTAARDFLLRHAAVRSRHRRSLYLSAARSYLFNRIVAQRVRQGTWNRAIPGDIFMFTTSRSIFRGDATSNDINGRVAALAIHPSGSLWGRGEPLVSADAETQEQEALQDVAPLCAALERAGLERAMRPLRLSVSDLRWQFIDDSKLELDLCLPAGAYATSVLREIIRTDAAEESAEERVDQVN